MTLGMMFSVRVAVCTDLESNLLDACIDSIYAQDLSDNFELSGVDLVVNRNLGPDNVQDLQALQEKFPSLLISFEPKPGIPFARNKALQIARRQGADLLAFIDDDCVADSDWLKHLVEGLIDFSVDASSGSWTIEPCEKPSPLVPRNIWGRRRYQFFGYPTKNGDRIPHAYTRNVIFKVKNAVSATGDLLYFDTSRVTLGGSDVIFFKEYSDVGNSIAYVEKAHVTEQYCSDRLTLRWHMLRKIRNIQFIIERGLKGETLYFPRNAFGILVRLIALALGIKTASYRKPRAYSWPKLSFSLIGSMMIQVSQLVGILAFIMGIRHESYFSRRSRPKGQA